MTIIADYKTMSNINYITPTVILIPSETTSAKYISTPTTGWSETGSNVRRIFLLYNDRRIIFHRLYFYTHTELY